MIKEFILIFMKRLYSLLYFILFLPSLLFAQSWPADTIKTVINTGNPKFPFPQFNEYAFGKTLAKYNGEGVTHADMEKAMKEGYKIMMHRCLYSGRTYGGVKYIVYNHPNVPANYGTFVSEGDGYALLAAAYFADKAAFDGLWMWIHDNRMSNVKKYYNCTDLRPTYPHGANMPGWQCDETTTAGQTSVNSATDGDYDIAMGLLIATMQWGDNMGINDACGQAISYKKEALNVIKALVDTVYYTKAENGAAAGVKGYLTGDIGIDGYCKNGNTWGEITDWRTSAANTTYLWAKPKPDPLQIKDLYTDYIGPAYFNQFAKYLTANGGTPWQINQFLRGEASSDWLIGQMYGKGYIASSGQCTVSDNGATTTFGQHPSGPSGEDFRASWRTILNYVWHGNPATKWDPAAHAVVAGANTYEYDMGVRHASFLKFPRTNPTPANISTAFCSTLGASPDPSCPTWKGVVQIKQAHLVTGAVGSGDYRTNYNVGTGAVAAVASGDVDLVAEIYRQNEVLWDDASALSSGMTDAQRYEQSTPKYFHDWFRLLGMLTASGNLHPPTSMLPAANMKVYMAVDKTFAYEGDLITYTVSYRNYGSIAAAGVAISTLLDSDYQFVSATNGGVLTGSTINWNIGAVPGFQTATGIPPTQGTVQFIVRVKQAPVHARVCLISTITASNAPSWTSNEFPNNATYTMERNCVDLLLDRVLIIKKTTDRSIMNPGDIANFKLDFENKSGSNLWLNGGRDRVILSYGNNHPTNGTSFYQFFRIWHTAHEAYINLHNYRASYFLNDAAAIGLYNAATNPTGWDTYVDNQSDLDKYGYNPLTLPVNERLRFTYERIPWGSDANGSWNQRIVTQFANVLTAPTTHIYDKLDSDYLIHKGVEGPGFTRTRFESKPSSDLTSRLADDWSYSPSMDVNNINGQALRFFPISPTYTNFATNFAPVVVNNYSKDICDANVPNYNRILFEEFDGYVWRRIAGNGPLPGRETYNVVVTDSIPKELTFNSFTDNLAVGVVATYTALAGNPKFSGYIKWTIPIMLTGEQGDLAYKAVANTTCPNPDKNFINTGWIWSDVDSPDSSSVALKITCNPVPPTAPVETSLNKTANKTNVSVGDVVTYTLEFKNTDGSAASWAGTGTLASDWQALGTGTNIPDINNANISLDQNSNPGLPPPYAFGHKKSHGKNGWVEATIDPTNSSPLSFIFRHSGGTPGQADFQGVRLEIIPNPSGGNTINFTVYNNTTAIATFTNLAYPGTSDPFSIRTELIDDKLYIWVNNFTGAPLKVVSGITQLTAGYAGIYANGSQQNITAWKTHLDSSFDLVMTDPVPAQLNNITAISNGGILSGSTITWPTIPGPIAAGSSTIRTFQATVNSCADFITNIGHASVYGINNIASQYVVSCVTTTPVELISFTGSRTNHHAVLNWSTATEKNNAYFIIQRSTDGIHFDSIGFVKGKNNSSTISHYSFADENISSLTLYYQLKQVDNDNTSSKSKIISLQPDADFGIYIYPNPFFDEAIIKVNSSEKKKLSIKVTTVTGVTIYHSDQHVTNEEIKLGQDFADSVYFFHLSFGEESKVVRVVRVR
jgi:uncharacterized repeat protein (TIGR01451 family)